MKKVLISIVVIIALVFFADFVYKTYKRYERETKLTDDRAVIFVYNNLRPEETAGYFEITESEFEAIQQSYQMECDVEQYDHLFLINNKSRFPVHMINCNEEFNFASQLEMKKEYEDQGRRLRVKLMEMPRRKIIASKYIYVPYIYGKVNHIVIENGREYLHCVK